MMKQKTSPLRAVAFLALLAGACTMILPFVWMLSTSLKESNLVYTIPPQWIPNPVDWQNYRDVWSAANLLTGIKNSCVITFSVMAFSTLTSSMAAFAFAKLRFPGKNVIFMMLLATMMVPAVVLLVPDFIIYTKLTFHMDQRRADRFHHPFCTRHEFLYRNIFINGLYILSTQGRNLAHYILCFFRSLINFFCTVLFF